MFRSTWKDRISGKRTTFPLISPHGGDAGLLCAGTTGNGMLPSKPMRKLFRAGSVDAGLHRAPPAPVELHNGFVTLMVCAKPMPSDGIITLCTVFCRS